MKDGSFHYLLKILLTIYHSIRYAWKGLDSLIYFIIDVSLLFGDTITDALLQGQYQPESFMMLLLSISDIFEDYTVQKTKSALKDSLALNFGLFKLY